jgi:hypothetical protein
MLLSTQQVSCSYDSDQISTIPSSDSDRFEELLVNPTLLTLTRQRGAIDCGGLAYLIIRYGFVFQLVIPLKDGHISIAFEPQADPVIYIEQVTHILRDHALLAGV